MSSFNYISNKNLELLNILKSVDLKKIIKPTIDKIMAAKNENIFLIATRAVRSR